MTYLDYLEQKVLLERLVIGLEEPVLVKGLGELQAKIDSGNGGYNVIHGTDLHQQGNKLTFTTKDKFEHETKMTATVVDDIDVNMGGGNIEKRPVIELDIKFGNEDYKKIPFSVSDRSTNTHPILISKGFVENELKALIDVGATNISNDGIDVVYGESVLNEGAIDKVKDVMSKPKTSAANGMLGGLWNATKGAVGGALNATKGLAKMGGNIVANAGDILQGNSNPLQGAGEVLKNTAGSALKAGANLVGSAVAGTALLTMGLWKGAKMLLNQKASLPSDVKLVLTKLPNSVLADKINSAGNLQVQDTIWENYEKVKFNSDFIVPIADSRGFIGNLNDPSSSHPLPSLQGRRQSWKQAMNLAKEKVRYQKQKNKNNSSNGEKTNETQQEQKTLTEAILMLEDNAPSGNPQGHSTQGIPQPAPTTKPEETKPEEEKPAEVQPTPTAEETQSQDFTPEQVELIEKVTTQIEDLAGFTLFFVVGNYTEQTKTVNRGGTEAGLPIDEEVKVRDVNRKATQVLTQYLNGDKFDKIFDKLYNVGKVNNTSIEPVIKNIAANLNKINNQNAPVGCFALVTGQPENRQVFLFEDLSHVVVKKTKAAQDKEQADSEANETKQKIEEVLSSKFPQLKVDDKIRKRFIINAITGKEPNFASIISNQDIVNDLNRMKDNYNKATENREKLLQDAIAQFSTNTQLDKDIMLNQLKSNEIGQQILKNIGVDSFNNYDQFIQACSENKVVLDTLLKQEEQQDLKWINDKLNQINDIKIQKETQDQKWVRDKLNQFS